MMFNGLSHVDVAVTRLDRALALWSTATGFPVRRQGEGFADVDAGNVLVRLVEVDRVERRGSVRLHAQDVAAALQALTRAGATLAYAPARTPQLELVGAARDQDGNMILVGRDLTEDEYDFVPPIPVTTRWDPDAEKLLLGLLRPVPALFRGLARRKVTRCAEDLAQARPVTKDDVVRAYIVSNAKVTRYRLEKPLKDHGYDPRNYPQEWES